jgi:hypothetical protein
MGMDTVTEMGTNQPSGATKNVPARMPVTVHVPCFVRNVSV